MQPRIPKGAGELCLVVLSLALGLVVLEIALQTRQAWARRQVSSPTIDEPEVPLHIVLDEPTIYGLNPQHPEISSQGLRNQEVVIPKPANRKRILVLGDSVTFGTSVRREEAYPARLEAALARQGDNQVEVINAGVSGYSPFNQLQYYKTRGRALEPDIVVVGFCMNDVANPRLHWDNTGTAIAQIPDDAIPNELYASRLSRKRDSLLIRSVLYTTIKSRLFRNDATEKLPTFITGEDPNLSIQVLVDQDSQEWRWLTSMYDQLRDELNADGAELIIVVFPLEYQLDAGYPHLPQQNLNEYCESRGIRCLDLLPRFREDPFGDYYLQDAGIRDPWHLSTRGHELTAMLLADLLLATP